MNPIDENDVLFNSVNDTGIFGKKDIRVLLSEVEPKTFRFKFECSTTELHKTCGS